MSRPRSSARSPFRPDHARRANAGRQDVQFPGDRGGDVTRAATGGESARWHPVTALASALNARMAQWMRRRQGSDRLPTTLERRRLYILPTRAGLAFTALLFLMLLAGLNYANSLPLFLTFRLTGFALVVMQQCHRNLLGTEVVAAIAPAVFAKSRGAVQLTLGNTDGVQRMRLEAKLPQEAVVRADLAPHTRERLE